MKDKFIVANRVVDQFVVGWNTRKIRKRPTEKWRVVRFFLMKEKVALCALYLIVKLFELSGTFFDVIAKRDKCRKATSSKQKSNVSTLATYKICIFITFKITYASIMGKKDCIKNKLVYIHDQWRILDKIKLSLESNSFFFGRRIHSKEINSELYLMHWIKQFLERLFKKKWRWFEYVWHWESSSFSVKCSNFRLVQRLNISFMSWRTFVNLKDLKLDLRMRLHRRLILTWKSKQSFWLPTLWSLSWI